MLLENGAAIKDVQHRLGHKNIQVTQIYAHPHKKKCRIRPLKILNQDSHWLFHPEFTRKGYRSSHFYPNFKLIYPVKIAKKPVFTRAHRTLFPALRWPELYPDENLGTKGVQIRNLTTKCEFLKAKEPPVSDPFRNKSSIPRGLRPLFIRFFHCNSAGNGKVPTIGLLPMPIKPIISTSRNGREPANCASLCILHGVC